VLPGQVPASDSGCAGPSGVPDLAVADEPPEVFPGVAAFPGRVGQREGRLVALPKGGLEFVGASLKHDR